MQRKVHKETKVDRYIRFWKRRRGLRELDDRIESNSAHGTNLDAQSHEIQHHHEAKQTGVADPHATFRSEEVDLRPVQVFAGSADVIRQKRSPLIVALCRVCHAAGAGAAENACVARAIDGE